jgi:hypothetical protein
MNYYSYFLSIIYFIEPSKPAVSSFPESEFLGRTMVTPLVSLGILRTFFIVYYFVGVDIPELINDGLSAVSGLF